MLNVRHVSVILLLLGCTLAYPLGTKLVVGVDFGTAFSGYSIAHTSNPDVTPSVKSNWPGALVPYPKARTALLLSPNLTVVEWGQPAIDLFSDPNEDMKHHHLVTNFKMGLFDKSLAEKFPLPPITLVAMYLEKLMESMTDENIDIKEERIQKSEIAYYLTIPAIWSDSEKVAMRQAAIQAGMVTRENSISHLQMILEPEAALVYAMRDLKKKIYIESGDVVLIVDAGGGTVDLTTHEMTSEGLFKEVCIGGGGPFGGMYVDNNFINYVEQRYPDGQNMFQTIRQTMPIEYTSFIYRDWIVAKHNDDGNRKNSNIVLPGKMSLFLKDQISDQIQHMYEPDEIYQLRLSRERIDDIFKNVLDSIKDEVRKQISKAKAVGKTINKMVLVGGFSSSPLLRNMLRTNFGEKIHVYSPDGPSKAIVVGAAWHGVNPITIESRVLRRTYGMTSMVPFIVGVHNPLCNHTLNGANYCRDGVAVFARKGDSVSKDHKVVKRFFPVDYFSLKIRTKVVTSDMMDPRDASDAIEIFPLEMKLPGKGLNRCITAEFSFGLSEVKIRVTEDVTNSEVTMTLGYDEKKQ
ncbi:hypothetical protein AKO1_014722 [Acrasis kona]|uniref:Uncharacterized protein n=1 Tax=Acrasis kona TaxID=1008807 RepID=A0AAW2Z201_9EUKA